MIVNVVLLVHNRHMLTHQTLRTLYRHTPMDLFNLTICDDESAIPTKPLRPEHKANFVSLRIDNSKHITGMARNLGVYFAEKYWGRGDYLYLSDNDVFFTPYWLGKLINHADAMPDVKVWGGWNHPYLQPTPLEKSSSMYPAAFDDMRFAFHDAITGASQLMRWETWDRHGPLTANAPGVCQSEDWEFCQRIVKDGGRVGSIYPRVAFNCGLTNSFGKPAVGADVMLKELQEAKKQYPELFWE
jgi:GT2 family glycosyltransferase